MYVFIATIFLAELIIAGFFVSLFLKFDKKVLELNCLTVYTGNELIKTTKEVREILISAQNVVSNAVNIINKKKHEIRQKLINLAIIYAILIVFKMKFKRAAAILQYTLLAKEVWDRIPV